MLVGWKDLKYQKFSNKSPYTFASQNNKPQDYDAKIHIGINMTWKKCAQNKSLLLILSILPLLWDNTNLIPEFFAENPTILSGDAKGSKTKCKIVEKLIVTTISKFTTFHSITDSIQIDYYYPLIH